MPAPRGLQDVEGLGGRTLGGAADGELHDHDGQTQNDEEDEIHQDEGRAAVFTGDVGEAPHVAQADGAAGRDEDEAETTGEVLAGRGGRSGGVGVVARGADWGGGGGVGGHGNLPGAGFQMLLHWTPERFE